MEPVSLNESPHESTRLTPPTQKTVMVNPVDELLQMEDVQKNLHEAGISIDLLRLVPVDTISKVTVNSCTLTSRMSYDELVSKFAAELKESQDSYKENVRKSHEHFMKNSKACMELDRILDNCEPSSLAVSTSDSSVLLKQRDGTKQLTCPFFSCQVKTFRLRRHLGSFHSELSPTNLDFVMKMAIMMASNSEMPAPNKCDESLSDKTSKTDMRGDKKTNLVSRRHNWKLCVLCETLQSNMTTHLKVAHKIDKDMDPATYRTYIKDSNVVPKCYIKKVNGRMVLLNDAEMESAKMIHQDIVEIQMRTNEKLKELREKRENLFEKKNSAETEEERKLYTKQWEQTDSEYKALRYKDTRGYSDKLKIWKESFNLHLNNRHYTNPKRMSNMVFDIMLNYEKNNERCINSQDIFEPRNLREILRQFKEMPNTTATSKLKYLGAFNLFVKFLFLDIDSPENADTMTSADLASRDFKFKQVQQEINTYNSILSKYKGSDLIVTKEKAKQRLVCKGEIDDLLEELSNSLVNTYQDIEEDRISLLSIKEKIAIRDKLIAVAAIRLARRSKELIRLKVDEVRNAVVKEGEKCRYHMISVHEHKNSKKGVPATIAYTVEEFHVLNFYIRDIRNSLLNGLKSPYVFTHEIKSSRSRSELSYVDLFHILKKFKTKSGKSISSRIIRGSAVTHSRKMSLPEERKRDMAVSMGHSMDIQEKNYNYEEESEASLRILNSRQDMLPSSQLDTSRQDEPSTSGQNEPSTSRLKGASRMRSLSEELGNIYIENAVDNDVLQNSQVISGSTLDSSMSGDQCNVSDANICSSTFDEVLSTEEDDQPFTKPSNVSSFKTSTPTKKRHLIELEETVKLLRNMKIKVSNSIKDMDEEIREALVKFRGQKHLFRTAKGNITIKPLRRLLSHDMLSRFTTGEVKKSLSRLLEDW